MKLMHQAGGQQGFTYLIALFLVAILSFTSLAAMERTLTRERREKEAQLIFVGQAYRQAIGQYYQNAKSYPTALSNLLDAPGTSTTQRYLRRLYWDPMTNSSNWGTVLDDHGGITGVYSNSTQEPIKSGNFPAELSNFIGAKTYQQWQFIYLPNQ